MFIGTFETTVCKNRVKIPSRLREGLGETCIIAVGEDGCLELYPIQSCKKFVDKNLEMFSSEKDGAFQRHLLKIRKDNRILLSEELCKIGKISDEVVFAGVGTKIEIWAKSEWEKDLLEQEKIAEDLWTYLDT